MTTKKPNKKSNTLSPTDRARLWGEDGPYSQVRTCEETRILDDYVSRVFLVVEAEINPFTFEYVKAHRRDFSGDEAVQQMLDHAEDRDMYGYVVSAGEVPANDPQAAAFVAAQKRMVVETILRMHAYVMEACGLRKTGMVRSVDAEKSGFVWNEETNSVEQAEEDELWEGDAQIASPAGVVNGKARMFVVLPFAHGVPPSAEAERFITTLKNVADEFAVDIEDIESFQEYILLSVHISFEVAPDTFVRRVIDGTNANRKTKMLNDTYYITNVHKPTPRVIMQFLGQLTRPDKKK